MLSVHLWFRVDPLLGVNALPSVCHESTINEWRAHIKRHMLLLTYQTCDHGNNTSKANKHPKCLPLLYSLHVHIIIHLNTV